jgi:hypothetical protein
MSSKVTLGWVAGLVFTVALVVSGTASASRTPEGLKADGLRLQALAQHYKQMQGTTALGLKADGLRLQAIAQHYQRLENRPAASFYTPEALRANGLRWQAMAQLYSGQRTAGASASSSRSGFDWGAAFIGAASTLGFAVCCIALLLGSRRLRRQRVVEV